MQFLKETLGQPCAHLRLVVTSDGDGVVRARSHKLDGIKVGIIDYKET